MISLGWNAYFSISFRGWQKSLENWMNDNDKQVMPIQVLLYIIYNHCLTMVMAILVWKNANLNFCNDSWLKVSLLPHIEGDKRL